MGQRDGVTYSVTSLGGSVETWDAERRRMGIRGLVSFIQGLHFTPGRMVVPWHLSWCPEAFLGQVFSSPSPGLQAAAE